VFKRHVCYDLLEIEDWEAWQQDLAHFFGKAFVRGYWQGARGRCARTFRAFADGLVARTAAAASGQGEDAR
jgi:hypothetical protein